MLIANKAKALRRKDAALRAGYFGDGKIFIQEVENVVKISAGEEGYAALQDSPDKNNSL
jgi:Amt family ammonium transporter